MLIYTHTNPPAPHTSAERMENHRCPKRRQYCRHSRDMNTQKRWFNFNKYWFPFLCFSSKFMAGVSSVKHATGKQYEYIAGLQRDMFCSSHLLVLFGLSSIRFFISAMTYRFLLWKRNPLHLIGTGRLKSVSEPSRLCQMSRGFLYRFSVLNWRFSLN
jgi:hypothetical protein